MCKSVGSAESDFPSVENRGGEISHAVWRLNKALQEGVKLGCSRGLQR